MCTLCTLCTVCSTGQRCTSRMYTRVVYLGQYVVSQNITLFRSITSAGITGARLLPAVKSREVLGRKPAGLSRPTRVSFIVTVLQLFRNGIGHGGVTSCEAGRKCN